MADILVFVECPKSIASEVLVVLHVRSYKNVKSIRQAIFKISRSQAIFCIYRYNVNLQTAVAAILVFIECPKSLASNVLVVLRPYQNVKPIRQVVFKISLSKPIVDGRTDRQTVPFHLSSGVLKSYNKTPQEYVALMDLQSTWEITLIFFSMFRAENLYFCVKSQIKAPTRWHCVTLQVQAFVQF